MSDNSDRVGVAIEFTPLEDAFELDVKVLNLGDPDDPEVVERVTYLIALALASYAPGMLKDEVREELLKPFDVVDTEAEQNG